MEEIALVIGKICRLSRNDAIGPMGSIRLRRVVVGVSPKSSFHHFTHRKVR
jgi:hypothetical protein